MKSDWQKELDKIGESYINYRKVSYKGKGRPKKSDYIKIKVKDLPDYQIVEMLKYATTTNYTK